MQQDKKMKNHEGFHCLSLVSVCSSIVRIEFDWMLLDIPAQILGHTEVGLISFHPHLQLFQ